MNENEIKITGAQLSLDSGGRFKAYAVTASIKKKTVEIEVWVTRQAKPRAVIRLTGDQAERLARLLLAITGRTADGVDDRIKKAATAIAARIVNRRLDTLSPDDICEERILIDDIGIDDAEIKRLIDELTPSE